MDLFSSEKRNIKLPDAELVYIPNFLSDKIALEYFDTLKKDTSWQEDDITIFGKTYKQPRLTALYGESKKPYSYSNITMQPVQLTKTLSKLKMLVEKEANVKFSSVLLNLYRNGNDSNGWHADNEKELGTNPIIASLSLGTNRIFQFKHRHIKSEKYKIVLENGSLLIMSGEMQHNWLHQIPKTKKTIGERINLTFRRIY
jgi:alkylated DNA repair dioxygenase AlkB